MQWSCPHCGVSLAIPNEKVGAGWSFSRCYKCGGFALVRRTEVNIIKVDKAPPGERVLLPEASEDPATTMLSKKALNNFIKNDEKIKKTQLQNLDNFYNPSGPTLSPRRASQESKETKEVKKNTFDITKATIPNPLPELPSETKRDSVIPIGIIVSTTMAVVSGFYLFTQSQSLWHKARDMVKNGHRMMSTKNVPSENPTQSVQAPHENTNEISLAKQDLSAPVVKPEIVDHVQQSAMAPMKIPPTPLNDPLNEKKEMLPQQSFVVKIREKRTSLHSGPGMNFPIIGTAGPEINYIATEWNNRWFKLLLKDQKSNHPIGWIQNDSVQILSEIPGDRIAAPNINPLGE